MGTIFNMEGPLMRALTKIADLIILNILTFICSIPIVTMGAALTALHYECLKMVRGEETYIVRGFFKSFKENFKQATIIWLILLLGLGVFAGDILVMYVAEIQFPFIVRAVILVMGILMLSTAMYVFPMQAKFANPVTQTIKNAFKASMMQFHKTLIMIVMIFVPPVMILLYGNLIPLVLMLWFSVPAYVSALLYNKFFKKIEDRFPAEDVSGEDAEQNDDERIFHDELDPALAESDGLK